MQNWTYLLDHIFQWSGRVAPTLHQTADLLLGTGLLACLLLAYRVLRRKIPEASATPLFFGLLGSSFVGFVMVDAFHSPEGESARMAAFKFLCAIFFFGSALWIRRRFQNLSLSLASERELAAARATAESEDKLRAFANSQESMIWFNAPTGAAYFYNDFCTRYLGFAPGRFHPDDWMDRVHPADRAEAGAAWVESIRTGQDFSLTYRFRENASGEYRPFRVRVVPQKGVDGRVVRWYGSAIEEPAAQQWAERAQRTQRRLFRLLASGPSAVGVFSGEDFTCDFADERLREILGHHSPEGLPLASLLTERSHQALRKLIAKAETEGGTARWPAVKITVGGFHGGGPRRLFDLGAAVLAPEEGIPKQAVFFLEDRSEERAARSALLASEEKFRRVFASNLLGMFFWNVHGEITDANEAFLNLTGWRREELRRLSLRDLSPDKYQSLDMQAAEEFHGGSPTASVEKEIFRKDGSAVPVLTGSAWISRSRGEGVSFVFDLTAQKIAEEERTHLLAHAESAREASQLKSQFLANMSHEIRTPLHAVLGFSRLLQLSPLGEEEREYVKGIERSGQNLLRLINDILDLSRLEARRLALSAEDLDFSRAVENAAEMVRAGNPGAVPILLQAPGPIPCRVRADGVRLNQLLTNIIGNAVKFTERGQVVVRWRCEEEAGSRQLTVEVEDTGIGIEASCLARLFRPFEQADATHGRRFAGTGLGLWISRQIAQLFEGDVILKSEPGRGTTATIRLRLPAARAACEIQDAEPRTIQPLFRGPRVLVAEDNEMNQTIVRKLLERLGCRAEVAPSGQLTIEKAQREPFDLLLLDCQMPDTDGYAVARALRAFEESRGLPRLPIIALTADAMLGARQRCEEAGMDDYLTKPLDFDLFVEKLSTQLRAFQEDASVALPIFDADVLAQLMAVSPDGSLAREVVEIFGRAMPARLEKLRALEGEEDMGALARELHSLKSCFATVGLRGLASLAERAEGSLHGARPRLPQAELAEIRAAYPAGAEKLQGWLKAQAPAPRLEEPSAGREGTAPRNW